MKVTSAEYVKSFVSIHKFDLETLPSIAFIGRSNVGKSSLINSLLNRKKLVKTSSTPGKTQLLNYFLINKAYFFVDLPGYGFASVPDEIKGSWLKMIQDYLLYCPNLRLIVQLIDIRHRPSKDDIEFHNLLKLNRMPCLVIANKLDKITKNQMVKSTKEIMKILELTKLPLAHSALNKKGGEEIWNVIDSYLI